MLKYPVSSALPNRKTYMYTIIPYLLVSAGIVLIYFGAECLVDASAKLALRLGVKPLLIGLTIVAFGTSAPELVVSIQSALAGAGGISVGNVIGSNICNVALILGVSVFIRPILVSKQLFRFDIPLCVFASLLAWFFLADGMVWIWEGTVLLAFFAGYISFSIVSAKRGGSEPESYPDNLEKNGSIAKDIMFIVVGLGMLVIGANLLVKGAVTLARGWGVSDAAIGLTIVAIGTSLPELATSVVAAFKKQNDIAIGNVVGSNIFNVLFILGTVGVMGPVATDGILLRDILWMVALTVALFVPLLSGHVLARWSGAALLTAYASYIFILAKTFAVPAP